MLLLVVLLEVGVFVCHDVSFNFNFILIGVGGLLLLALLAIFCLRRRRRHEFDGNFDPANITSGGGTLPKIDLGEGGIIGNGGGGGLIEEDDGMGGRLGAGAGGGGIITPYAFVPPAPVGGTGVAGGSHQYQNPQMSNVGMAGDGVGVAAAVAGYGNEKRAARHQHTASASVSSGSHYPASSSAHYQNLTVGSPEPQSATTDGVSVDGSGGAYYRQSGPSPSSSSGGGRNAKEMEATGRIVIANPDEGAGQLPGFQRAYLQIGPGPQHQRGLSSSSLTTTTTNAARSSQASPTPSRAGTAVVVHEDGGRVVLRKGETEEPEVLNTEIPPTYDSLPVDVRRES